MSCVLDYRGVTPIIASLVRQYRFTFADEKDLQQMFAQMLDIAHINYKREYVISEQDRPDFFLPDTGTVIELKVAGSLNQFLRVLHRYAQHDIVKELILLCPKPFRLPNRLQNKPVVCIGLYQSLL